MRHQYTDVSKIMMGFLTLIAAIGGVLDHSALSSQSDLFQRGATRHRASPDQCGSRRFRRRAHEHQDDAQAHDQLAYLAHRARLALILRGMSFSVRDSQLLCLPPYAGAVTYGFFVGWAADRARMRGPFIISGALMALTGCVIVGWGPNPGSRYIGSFFAIAGCQSNIPSVLSWSVNNVRGYGARAISSAIVVAAGGVGGIIAGASYRQQDAAGGYRPGLWTTIAAQLTVIAICLGLMGYFRKENRTAERGETVIQGMQGEFSCGRR